MCFENRTGKGLEGHIIFGRSLLARSHGNLPALFVMSEFEWLYVGSV